MASLDYFQTSVIDGRKRGRRMKVLCVLFWSLLVCMLGIDFFLYSRTFISIPVVSFVFLLFGLVGVFLLGSRCYWIIKSENKYFNMTFSGILGGIMGLFFVLGINYWASDDSSSVETTVAVTNVFIKKYSHHRRFRRVSGSETFYMTIANEDGLTKNILISRERYNALAARMHLGGQKVQVRLNEGCLGFKIIRKV